MTVLLLCRTVLFGPGVRADHFRYAAFMRTDHRLGLKFSKRTGPVQLRFPVSGLIVTRERLGRMPSMSALAIMRKSRNIPVEVEVSQSQVHTRWPEAKAGIVAELPRRFAEPTSAYVLLLSDRIRAVAT
jgi:hypothetical protein